LLGAFGVTLDEVASAVEASNQNSTGGVYVRGDQETLIRVVGRFAGSEEIEAVVVRVHEGVPVLVGQVAEVVVMEVEVITVQDIFIYERQGTAESGKVMGRYKARGIGPKFADRLQAYGIKVGALLFDNTDHDAPTFRERR
jgi:hypothetical protein